MRIAVDMDNTLFDEFGQQIRPGIPALLRQLRTDGHELVLWTSSTSGRALTLLADHGLDVFFSDYRCREDYDPLNKGAIKDLRLIGADAIIDDDPKHVEYAKSVGKIGILVASYRGGPCRPDDLAHVLPAVTSMRARLRLWFGS